MPTRSLTSVVALVLIALATAADGATNIRLCVPDNLNSSRLDACNKLMQQASTNDVTFTCYVGNSSANCLEAVSEGKADIVNLDGGNMYAGFNSWGLRPIASENNGGGVANGEYYGVAIVPKSFCDGTRNKTLADLKGKRACMTGYRRSVGWNMPIGQMLTRGIIPASANTSQVSDDAESAAAFFSKICAVADGNGPLLQLNGTRQQWDQLCTACKNTTNGQCSKTDQLWDYGGAFRGVVQNDCDVAFTKSTVLDEYVQGGATAQAWAPKSAADYRLLCPSGGCATKDQVAQCNFGTAPAHAWAVRASMAKYGANQTLGQQIQNALVKAANTSSWRSAMADFDLLESDTVSVDKVWVTSLDEYIQPSVVEALDTINRKSHTARFCVTSDAEMEECQSVIAALSKYDQKVNKGGRFQWSCFKGDSAPECMDYVAGGIADIRMLDAINAYEGCQLYNLVPLVREVYGEDGNKVKDSYYAVAVVNKDVCDNKGPDGKFTIKDLRNTSACMTGYRTAAGWWAPLSALAAANAIYPNAERAGVAPDAQAIDSFFDSVCAPGLGEHGPLSDQFGNPSTWQPLCSACADPRTCNGSDLHSGDQGPIRGLFDGTCGVAFTKHMMPLEYTSDGTEASEAKEWGVPLKQKSDLRLVCSQGGCDTVDNFASCNLGQVPARLAMTWPDYPYRRDLAKLMADASTDKDTKEALFKVDNFWAELTNQLEDVSDKDVLQYLGNRLPAYQRLYSDNWLGIGDMGVERDMNNVLLCIPANASTTYLQQCTTAMSAADDASRGISFTCVAGGTPRGCMDLIEEGNADITVLDPRDQYYAIDTFKILPLAHETYTNGRTFEDYAVAVVKESFCTPNVKLSSLKNKNACMTGYGKIAGWQLPIGHMAEQGLISTSGTVPSGVQPDAYAVGEYFNKVCAPDVTYLGPRFTSTGAPTTYDKLCDGCPGGSCLTSDSSDDEDGDEQNKAVECLLKGGDVAFVKYSAALNLDLPNNTGSNFADEYGQGISSSDRNGLRLLCPQGGCAPLSNVSSCFIDQVPARAFVGRSDLVGSPVAQALVRNANKLIAAAAKLDGSEVEHFPFHDNVKGLVLVDDWEREWGADTHERLEGVEQLRRPTMRLCVTSQPSLDLCYTVMDTLNTEQPHVTFDCVLPKDGNCRAAVKNNTADLAVLDSRDTYKAYKEDGLIAIAAEDEGKESVEYYAVALVKKETCANPNVTLQSLKGKDACFTGYQRTAGWVVPVGYMLYQNIMPFVANNASVQNDAESAAAYFGKVCAARVANNGPTLTQNGTGAKWDELCGACKGDCSTTDPYFDYEGAFRCLADGAGVVSFTKHEVPLEYAADGTSPKNGINLRKGDMRLLCPQGGCAPVDQYEQCSFAAVPAHAVVVRPDTPDIRRVSEGLEFITRSDGFANNVFNATANPNNLLFSSGVVALKPVDDTLSYLGRIVQAFDGFDSLSESLSAQGRSG